MKYTKNAIANDCLEQLASAANVKILRDSSTSKEEHDIDLFIKITNEEGMTAKYAVTIKRITHESLAESFSYELKTLYQLTNLRCILFSTHIPPNVARQFKEKGIEFADRSGNMFINLPWLKVFIMGYPNDKQIEWQTSLGSATALKVIYTILANPKVTGCTHREIAKAAGVSLGSVPAIYRELRSQGYLHSTDNNGETRRKIVNKAQLFDKWIAGYEDKLRRKLYLGSYRIAGTKSIGDLPAMLADTQQERVLIGGELGATLLEKGNLRPGSATLHLDENSDAKKLSLQLRMIPDTHGNVVFLQKFGAYNIMSEQKHPFSLTNPLLMYSELLQINDPRVREFAEHFFQSRINGIYNQ